MVSKNVIIKFKYLVFLVFTLSSCFSKTYNKNIFQEFELSTNNQNHLIKKNGYYFHEFNTYVYNKWVESNTGMKPTDSMLVKKIGGMIFYNNFKVLVIRSRFGDLPSENENSLKVAQKRLENRINELDYKIIDKKKNHITTLGKYRVKNDTITIQYFRHKFGDYFLTELNGVVNSNNEFLIFQQKEFTKPFIGLVKSKPKIYRITKNYKFKKY